MTEINPLQEASPTSLSEIFEKDPLLLTDEEVERVVQEFRAQRKNWIEKEAKPKKVAAKATLSLAELDIKL